MDGSGGPAGASWGLVPTWDGRPETFSHFLHEIKWSVSSSRKEDRALLGAKIIRKALQTGNPTLVQLLYKLDPSDFSTEKDLQKLIKFLEESPLNRQALPDAGNKIGGYYRRLRKRPGETVPAFLIREDRVHDEMHRALQRLLREKELDFDTYDVTVEELRNFCGFQKDQSLYYGNGEETEEETMSHTTEAPQAPQEEPRPASERTSTPRRPGQPFTPPPASMEPPSAKGATSSTTSDLPAPRGKDLLQRLMEKGLIPLAALDVIRGWMILEMSTQSDEERRLIRAATRNKLGYTDIKGALLSMYEEKAHRIPLEGPKGSGKSRAYFQEELYDWEENSEDITVNEADTFHAEDYGQDYDGSAAWWQDPWSQEAWWQSPAWNEGHFQDANWDAASQSIPEDSAPESNEAYAHLLKEQDEAEKSYNELQALMAENERNLQEARRAVAEAARDRGWSAGPQQRQQRFTSSYPGRGKGQHKSKGKPKGQVHYYEDAAWNTKGGKGMSSKGMKGYGNPKGYMNKGKYKDSYYMSAYNMYPITVEDAFDATGNHEMLRDGESIVDTGATATAGGQIAVQRLCTAVMNAQSSASMEVYTADRPWFRFGNGKWGRALFRVTLRCNNVEISIYSLPSPGVPVLTGMRDLIKLNAILNCSTGRCVINGNLIKLKMTSKRHLVLDYVKDIFMPMADPSDRAHETASSSVKPMEQRITVTNSNTQHRTGPPGMGPASNHFAEVHDLLMFSFHPVFSDVQDTSDSAVFSVFDVSAETKGQMAQHLNLSQQEIDFVLAADSASTTTVDPSSYHLTTDGIIDRHENRDEKDDARSPAGDFAGSQGLTRDFSRSQAQSKSQAKEDAVRRTAHPEGRQPRSSSQPRSMALSGRTFPKGTIQPLWQVDGMPELRVPHPVHSSSQCSRTNHEDRSASQCDGGITSPSCGWMGQERLDGFRLSPKKRSCRSTLGRASQKGPLGRRPMPRWQPRREFQNRST